MVENWMCGGELACCLFSEGWRCRRCWSIEY